MNDEIRAWLAYAQENIKAAEILLYENLFNACLQNAQQAVEKTLKALLIGNNQPLKKTHSIQELVTSLEKIGCAVEITEDEIDLIDSIYLPSKYPLGSALPHFEPNASICRQCLDIANRIFNAAIKAIKI